MKCFKYVSLMGKWTDKEDICNPENELDLLLWFQNFFIIVAVKIILLEYSCLEHKIRIHYRNQVRTEKNQN